MMMVTPSPTLSTGLPLDLVWGVDPLNHQNLLSILPLLHLPGPPAQQLPPPLQPEDVVENTVSLMKGAMILAMILMVDWGVQVENKHELELDSTMSQSRIEF